MDITLHTHHNISFKLELSFFDTVADIKTKIQSLTGISTSRQTLFLLNKENNPTHQLINDSDDIAKSNLLHKSNLSLIVRHPSPDHHHPHPLNNDDNHNVIVLLIQLPLSKRFESIQTPLKNKVSDLKDTISQRMKTSADLLTMFLRGKELEDEMLIGECDGIGRDDAVVEVGFVGCGYNVVDYGAFDVSVVLVSMNAKVPMKTNLMKSFNDLRKKLEKMKKENRISLPEEWFFVYGSERVLMEYVPFKKFNVEKDAVFKVFSTSNMHHSQPDTPPATINTVDSSPVPSPKVQIRLKMPTLISPILINMSPNDTFSMLKDKIKELEQIPTNRIMLHFRNKELHDQISMREFDGYEVGVSLKQSPTNSVGSGASQGSLRRMKINVLLAKNGAERIPVEVNVGDKVREVRKELERLQDIMGFRLPVEGYFFIYKQNVMDDDKSFRWHHVGQDDTIEMFTGTVTGGN